MCDPCLIGKFLWGLMKFHVRSTYLIIALCYMHLIVCTLASFICLLLPVITNSARDIEVASTGSDSINVTWSETVGETCTVNYVVYLLDTDEEVGGWLPAHTQHIAGEHTQKDHCSVTMKHTIYLG